MKRTIDLDYLNKHHTIDGSFYWVPGMGGSDIIKLVPAAQRNADAPLRDFGIGFIDIQQNYAGKEVYAFVFYIQDLQHAYGFNIRPLLSEFTEEPGDIAGDTIDELMQQVSAFIIVNGMCDLQHKELNREQNRNR